jgi:hypothetical protein
LRRSIAVVVRQAGQRTHKYQYRAAMATPTDFGHRADSSPPKCGASSLSDQTDPIADLTSLSRNGTHFPSIMTARF